MVQALVFTRNNLNVMRPGQSLLFVQLLVALLQCNYELYNKWYGDRRFYINWKIC